ncbi:hypothetical protein MPDQ_002753 [Monascus purpureus]|uniref:Hemerythrin-like domain-containing protein n=1 Tax=Monascus purpureus TaxID=5098 RepID=A0A507R2Y1_MONPU|nr:hypothetical protein MPDQ_002753 [Monascus purpureus]BDD60139.1 hypothetical protein MAP00_005299 [Monascus purpureus]
MVQLSQLISRTLQVVVVFIAIILALFYSSHKPADPMADPKQSPKPWADGPLPLVKTPMYQTGKDDVFTKGASHMALLHNAILRGYNTIYLQAPHVKPVDYADFIGYSLTWFNFVKKHHDDEEAELFPKVEEIVGQKGALAKAYEEHHTFMEGLVKFHDYLEPLSEQGQETQFNASTLLSIMDSFSEAFCHHFHSEIATIAALSETKTDNKDLAATVGPVFSKWGKASIMRAGLTDVVPFLFLNFDRTAEEGKWANWPPMPAPIRWGLVNVGGFWYSGWWRFSSCGYDGKPQTLYALRE